MSLPLTHDQQRVADLLATHELRHGLGNEETMCSVAAINLALRGVVDDARPDCMCPETERLALILDWMWGTVLPIMQPVADDNGLGAEWRAMCVLRTTEAAEAAEAAAEAAGSRSRGAFWATMDAEGLLLRLCTLPTPAPTVTEGRSDG